MANGAMPARMLGTVLVTVSAAVFALAGVLTKMISTDAVTIACWRGLVGGLIVIAYVAWRGGRNGGRPNFRLGWRGLLLAVIGAIASMAFIAAFKFTYVANVTIIYATVPFMAALLDRVLLGERFNRRTMVAALVCFAGVGIMVGGGLSDGGLLGNLLALAMTAGSALYIVLIRLFRETPVVLAGAVSAFMLFALGWFVTDPLDISRYDGVLLVAFGVSFAVGVILWTEGAKLIPAAESGLLGSAEMPFAVLFAMILLGELPPFASVIGGVIVLTAVLAHAAWDFRSTRIAPTLDPGTGVLAEDDAAPTKRQMLGDIARPRRAR